MSEQWRGLHNHDRHDDYTQEECYCNQCDEACFPPDPCLPCRCCLAAEVEALRAQAQEMKQQAHTSVSHALAEERAERAEAQVAAVRQVRDEWERIGQAFAVYAARLDLSRDGAIRDIDRALDGGDA